MDKIKQLFFKYYELLSYLFFGVLTTAVNVGTFFVLQKFEPGLYVFNNTVAWVVSVLFAFITNKIFVFKSENWHFRFLMKQALWFFGLRVLTLIIDDAIMIVGISLLNQSVTLTKIIDQVIIIVLNFVFSKISFHHKKRSVTDWVGGGSFHFRAYWKSSGFSFSFGSK